MNLKRLGQKVEIRVVLHKQTYRRLPQLAEFLTRNLLFVNHVALMGLEITGFTRANCRNFGLIHTTINVNLEPRLRPWLLIA